MKVLFFGSYDPASPRTRVLIKGLLANGVEVRHANVGPRRLPFAYASLVRRFDPDVDAVLVPHPGHHFVPLARALARRQRLPVVFDALVSLYDTFILDRKVAGPRSFGALHYTLIDRLSCACSDVVFLDTDQHVAYFRERYGIPLERLRRVPVGSDDEVFRPRPKTGTAGTFLVGFVGTFIPLHGLEHIVRAAKRLEGTPDVRFAILGRGQTYPEITRLARELDARNVTFLDPRPYEDLPEFLAAADVCLGIFGDTAKAKRVVPTKAFDILAMAKPLLTGASPAMEELGFKDRLNARLVKMGDAEAIADAVLELREDQTLRRHIAEDGYALFRERFTPPVIGATLKSVIEEAIEKRAG